MAAHEAQHHGIPFPIGDTEALRASLADMLPPEMRVYVDDSYNFLGVEQSVNVATYSFMRDGVDLILGRERAMGISLIDVGNGGELLGVGEIAHVVDAVTGLPLEHQPYVGYTETTGARRQGLGTRRLHVMNKLARIHFGQVLHSDPSGDSEPEAVSIWERLVGDGIAERYSQDLPVFRFIR